MNKILYIIILLPVMVLAQSQDQNYIKTTSYKTETTTSIPNPAVTVANVNVTYFDGLGRPIQQIAHAQSVSGKDIVTHIDYDAFGRQSREYLPYVPSTTASTLFKPTAATDVAGYYNSAQYSYCTNAFSEKQFEASPFNRVLQQAAPGNDWGLAIPTSSTVNHTIKLDYQTNTATEVKLYTATSTWSATTGKFEIALTGGTTNYNPNQLYKTITKDENWISGQANTTEEFKDKEGHVVLKRTYGTVGNGTTLEQYDTYYVFDQYGLLTYVIPPLANDPSFATQMAGLCYQYIYDYRNRLIEKKIPGKQWEFIIYDKLDRPIATGPAFSPFNDPTQVGKLGWLITKYDVFNRQLYTGWEESTTVTIAGRKLKQDAVNLQTTFSESKTTTDTTIDTKTDVFYTNNIAPTSFKLLTVNYYDNYDFPAFTPAITFAATDYNNTTLKPKGLPTGSWVRALTTLASNTGESSYTVYDYKARPIKTFTQNYLGGYTQVVSSLDFSGKTLSTTTNHLRNKGGSLLTITDNFAYTNQDRLLRHTQTINGTTEMLAENTYNELGQLVSKKVGNTTSNPLQNVHMKYNIRGWLTEINDVGGDNILNPNPLTKSGDPNDLFAFKINYNTIQNESSYIGTALFNGNIAETYWRTGNDNQLRKYGYSYDNLNRLKNAIYQRPGTTVPITNSYNESLTYDKNGNIKTLQRNGDFDSQTVAIAIDNLNYNYNSNSPNQLMSVTDAISTNDSKLGFSDGNIVGDDFAYDANGNMISDLNKKVTISATNKPVLSNIKYNHLNLPTEIFFATTKKVNYIYNALGVKLQKQVTLGTTNIETTDYLDGFQYLKSVNASLPVPTLQFFPTAEGYVNFDSGVYKYVYNYIDHLGSVRLSYTKDNTTGLAKIMDESHYYPFGLKHTNYNTTVLKLRGGNIQVAIGTAGTVVMPKNLRMFGNKELQNEMNLNFYDFGARNYMADIGRWGSVDPLAEKYYSISPYVYCANNPIFYVDPNGKEIDISELMKNSDHAKAFIQFAGTKEGIGFLNNFASKGQKLSYDGKVFYEAKEAGKYDKAGVNLNYSVGKGKTESNTTGEFKFSGNKFDVNISIAKESFGTDNKIFNLTKAIMHESFMHGDNEARDFMDDQSSNNSTIPKEYRKYDDFGYSHADHYYISREYLSNPSNPAVQLFPVKGFNLLKQVSNNLNLNYSNQQIKSTMWSFSGSLLNVNQKSGKLEYSK